MHAFTVSTPERTYYMTSCDQFERDSWISVIRSCISSKPLLAMARSRSQKLEKMISPRAANSRESGQRTSDRSATSSASSPPRSNERVSVEREAVDVEES